MKTKLFFSLCILVICGAYVALGHAAKEAEQLPASYHVDLPEERPAKGDLLEVYDTKSDTIYLGYPLKD